MRWPEFFVEMEPVSKRMCFLEGRDRRTAWPWPTLRQVNVNWPGGVLMCFVKPSEKKRRVNMIAVTVFFAGGLKSTYLINSNTR